MTKLLKLSVIFFFLTAVPIFFSSRLRALTYDYPNYDVDVTINKDSTYEVKETSTYKFYGTAHGLRRDITLDNPKRCTNATQTCGGFDRIELVDVLDGSGKSIKGDVKTYEVTDQTTGTKSYRIEWEIWSDGKDLNGDEVTWTIIYKIYGGISWVGSDINTSKPYFYWNMLPEDRGGNTESSTMHIFFPSNVDLNKNSLELYDNYNSQVSVDNSNKKVTIESTSLGSYSNFTVSYAFKKGELDLGVILYTLISPKSHVGIYLDGVKQTEAQDQGIINIPGTGSTKVEFKRLGYQTFTYNAKAGEIKQLEVELPIEAWMRILQIIIYVVMCLVCLTVPLSLFLIYNTYQKKGKDKNMPKTIIPLFSPPNGVAPYLLGTLKDERVDRQDIVGTIIDLAFRGYIKIKEIKKDKEYELTKLEGKKGDPGLNENEVKIMDALFNGEDVRSTKDMRTYFPQKYLSITKDIYQELVDKKFFEKSPATTRSLYAGKGVGLLILGIALSVGLSYVFTSIFLFPIICTPFFGFVTWGIAMLAVSSYMPAKTELGSKTFAEVLGFKMYLNTAERFRLQKLGPDEFERYLSYAVVFGIEKEWAEKFKDIYNKVPDWYEGTTPSVYNALWLSSFSRSFSNAAVTSMTPVSSSSGGGGWSGGGGSFGGFSGGGGGGGSSGAW